MHGGGDCQMNVSERFHGAYSKLISSDFCTQNLGHLIAVARDGGMGRRPCLCVRV